MNLKSSVPIKLSFVNIVYCIENYSKMSFVFNSTLCCGSVMKVRRPQSSVSKKEMLNYPRRG